MLNYDINTIQWIFRFDIKTISVFFLLKHQKELQHDCASKYNLTFFRVFTNNQLTSSVVGALNVHSCVPDVLLSALLTTLSSSFGMRMAFIK